MDYHHISYRRHLAAIITYIVKHAYPKTTIVVDITGKKISGLDEAFDYYLINYGKEDIL